MQLRTAMLSTIVITLVGATQGLGTEPTSPPREPASEVTSDVPESGELKERIVGKWILKSGSNAGEELAADEVEGVTLEVTEHNLYVRDRDDNEKYSARYLIKETNKPAWIDMQARKHGTESGRWSKGILKSAGEKLTICYGLPGEVRPDKFESTERNRAMLFHFERM